MDPFLRKLILKRFRSVPASSLTFSNPTFLVGRNGSGKSNLIDAFSFLADAMATPLQAVFDKRGGIATVRNKTSGQSYPPNLGLAVIFGGLNGDIASGRYAFEIRALPNYGFEVVREQCKIRTPQGRVWFDRQKGDFQSSIANLKPAVEPGALALPLVGGDARLAPVLKALAAMRVYSIEPAKLREMQDPDSGLSLRPDGANATSVLQEIERQAPADAERIGKILATIVPNTRRVGTIKHGKNLSLEFTQEWGDSKRLKFEAFSMSDGTLRAVGLLSAVYQRATPSLIAIEEPEASMHPGALGAVLDLIQHAASRMQVVITTHSPEVLDAKWIGDEHLRLISWEEGATLVGPPSDASRQAIQRHLMGAGDLLRANALERGGLFEQLSDAQSGLFDDDQFDLEDLPRPRDPS
jgi:predicted ATPase